VSPVSLAVQVRFPLQPLSELEAAGGEGKEKGEPLTPALSPATGEREA